VFSFNKDFYNKRVVGVITSQLHIRKEQMGRQIRHTHCI